MQRNNNLNFKILNHGLNETQKSKGKRLMYSKDKASKQKLKVKYYENKKNRENLRGLYDI